MYEKYFEHLRVHLRNLAQKKRSISRPQNQAADRKDAAKSKVGEKKGKE